MTPTKAGEVTSTRVGPRVLSSKRVRGALLASVGAAVLLAAGGTLAAALDVNNMAVLNGDPITCTEVANDPLQTDPPFAAGGSGTTGGVHWDFNDAERSLEVTFLPAYDPSSSYRYIVVKINNEFAVCDLGRKAVVGDVVDLTSTDEISAISWIKLQEGDDPEATQTPTPTPTTTLPEETEPPTPTPTPTTTLPEATPSETLEDPDPTSSTSMLPIGDPADPASSAGASTTASGWASLAATGAGARTIGILTGILVLAGVTATLIARRNMASRA